ncbi:MAG TPA: right-handed parallel beta-helix repeat-containing protein [Polyangiaceae bacterium]|nr:right-handed parallel beta-helix repeat-containing protein [Polyangiaceae bacterium]
MTAFRRVHSCGRPASAPALLALAAGLSACNPGDPAGEAERLAESSEGLIVVNPQLPDKAWFAQTAPVGTRYVAKDGSDYAGCGGTRATACKSIKQALVNLPEGYEVLVEGHATPYEGFTASAASLDGTKPRRIRGVEAGGQRVKIGPAGASRPVTFNNTAAYWVLDNVDVDCGCSDPNSTACTPPAPDNRITGVYVFYAHHVAVRNSTVRYCHNGGVNVLAGSHVTLENNHVHDNKGTKPNGAGVQARGDGNAFVLSRGASHVHIFNNTAHDNSGDGVQCQGTEQEPTNDPANNPKHITIENNRFYRNMENAVDIKTCWDVAVKGDNRFYGHNATEEPWMDTQAEAEGGCGGSAVVVHFGARRVLLEGARIYDGGAGVSIGRYDLAGVADIVVRRNLIYRMNHNSQLSWPRGFTTYNCGDGIKVYRGQNVEIYHNTVHDAKHGGILVRPSSNDPAWEDSDNIRIWNNIVSEVEGAGYPNPPDQGKLGGALVYRPGTATTPYVKNLWSEHNLFYRSGTAGPRFVYNSSSTQLSFDQWLAQTTYDDDDDATGANRSSVGSPLFGSPAAGDFRLAAGSAGLNNALADGTNVNARCGNPAKPDRGAVESDCSGLPPAALFADDFNRTTGLGANWATAYGSFSTDGANAVAGTPPANGDWARLVPALGTNDYVAKANLSVPAGAVYAGVAARSADASNVDRNLYSAQISTDGTVNLYRRNEWSWTLLSSAPAPISAGTTYALSLVATGSSPVHLEVWLDGTKRIDFNDSSTSRLTAGVPALVSYHAGVKYDAFRVESP